MPIETNILASYFDAGYPVVAVETAEERRLLASCKETWQNSPMFSIAAAGGLIDEKREKSVDLSMTFAKAFNHISTQKEGFLFVFDFQHIVKSASAYRPLLHVLDGCKARGTMIVLVAPTWDMPEELKHEVPVLNLPLPNTTDLKLALDVVVESSNKTPDNEPDLLSSARGLTVNEAESVFALSALSGEKFSKEIVEREKMRLVKSGCMSVERPGNPDLLGGLGQLKSYVVEEVLASLDDEQLQVRGMMLVGVPGVGKSLSAKVIAAILKRPLVRFDISAAKGSLVGQSESNIRKALATADAVSPCVLWIDEIEKAVGGYSSSGATDGGTTLAMVGTLLTWMQEHTSPVLTIATCNDFSKLPPEMTRAGRFDERFFLDLPSMTERIAIADVHLKALECAGNWAKKIAEISDEWTGAEIEQLIKSAARRTGRKLNDQILAACAREIIPISRTSAIKELRTWATTNLRRGNDLEVAPETQRKMKNVSRMN